MSEGWRKAEDVVMEDEEFWVKHKHQHGLTVIESLGGSRQRRRRLPLKRRLLVFDVIPEWGHMEHYGLVTVLGPAVAEEEDFDYTIDDFRRWVLTNYRKPPITVFSGGGPLVPFAWAGVGVAYFRKGQVELRSECDGDNNPFRLEILWGEVLAHLTSLYPSRRKTPVQVKISWEGTMPMQYEVLRKGG